MGGSAQKELTKKSHWYLGTFVPQLEPVALLLTVYLLVAHPEGHHYL
jgi:hypothetical protein